MTIHFERDIEDIKKKLFHLSGCIEYALTKAVQALEKRDADLAERVIAADAEIDEMEVNIEEDCLKILALHQPVAIDLRFMVALLKINNDLERIGDLCVNVSERVLYLSNHEEVPFPFEFSRMERQVQDMVRRSIDAMINMNEKEASKVCEMDDAVDAMNDEVYHHVSEMIKEAPGHTDLMLHKLCIARHLERIADLATNIAEDVIYMISGKIVRHKVEDYRG